MKYSEIENRIFSVSSKEEFNKLSLEIFFYQLENNPVYRKYISYIGKDIKQIQHYTQIPFLPIEFFRTQKVITGNKPVQVVFGSSGTTDKKKSCHYVCDTNIYEKSAICTFEKFYGKIKDYTILALLPSYLEKNDSSLIWMINLFINKSDYREDCGFFMNNYQILLDKIKKLSNENDRKILLFGVSYALLELSEKIKNTLTNVVVMETGGMKGMKKEIVREELHTILCKIFGTLYIHSEYGMTELLSQAYSLGKGIFKCPNWMKILTREINDPFAYTEIGQKGGINIIDLANINSCSFVETKDVGKLYNDGTFEVCGRFDNSDIRGCNLLAI